MAEFLVFDKNHWMDMLNTAEFHEMRARYPKTWDQKYLARYRRGDIIEVRPDGYWTGPKALKFNQEAFKVVVIPGLPADSKYAAAKTQIINVTNPTTGTTKEETIITRNRIWRFPSTPSGKIVSLPSLTAVQAK